MKVSKHKIFGLLQKETTISKFVALLSPEEKKQFDMEYVDLLRSELKLAQDDHDIKAAQDLEKEIDKILSCYKDK